MSHALYALAAAAGVQRHWEDASGQAQQVSDESLRAVLSALEIACATEGECRDSLAVLKASRSHSLVGSVGETLSTALPDGEVDLVLEDGHERRVRIEHGRLAPLKELGWHKLHRGAEEIDLAVCPPSAPTVLDRLGRRAWGVSAQLYALRDGTPRPFGDFGALASLIKAAADEGADAVALSPVHALFSAHPERYSPYSPSSRDFLNPLYADVGRLEDSGDLIDWVSAARSKNGALRTLFASLERQDAFDRFVAESGEDLRRFALFEALDAQMRREGRKGGFDQWPQAYRSPQSQAVFEFAAAQESEIRFHMFAQWIADSGLAAAQARTQALGMGLGLVSDLAVGVDPWGAHAWSRPKELLSGLTLGAPPDAFQPAGQDWGITTFSPVALKREGYGPFVRTLRAALRHAGGVRIDHALGLNRLWVTPNGARSRDGAYLSNPLDALLKITALEAVRSQAVIVGEDLGVVPPDLRIQLAERGILGMRVLPFERDRSGRFTSPNQWDALAVAMTSTHDLPPTAGWWVGRDIEWRERLKAQGDRSAERSSRRQERALFWEQVVKDKVAQGPQPDAENPQAVVDAAVAQVASSQCELALVPLEDLIGLDEQPNIPGVVDGHPNWRRRSPMRAGDIFKNKAIAARTAVLRKARPK